MATTEQHKVSRSLLITSDPVALLIFARHSLNGTDLGPGALGYNAKGLVIYDTNGYMSVSMATTTPEFIPPIRDPNEPTEEDFALVGKHILMYSGELSLAWENSTTTEGRVYHGPLLTSTQTSWIGTKQTRDYIVTKNASETGGRDILHLYSKNVTSDSIADIYWGRPPPT